MCHSHCPDDVGNKHPWNVGKLDTYRRANHKTGIINRILLNVSTTMNIFGISTVSSKFYNECGKSLNILCACPASETGLKVKKKISSEF